MASEALLAFAEHQGAVLWPEVEAVLCESRWVHQNVYTNFPANWFLDAVHLQSAREFLTRYGYLVPSAARLGGHSIVVHLHGQSIAGYGAATAIRRLAASKRRLYRTFIQWTSRAPLCGGHAESVVWASMIPLRGEALLIPKGAKLGRVGTLLGRSLTVGGPLDAAGLWVSEQGWETVPFAVEVKNLRGTIYPWDNEVWDLLAKLAAFPEVVPVLAARRIHHTSFNMFKDIGALGVPFRNQMFSPAIPEADFARVTGGLSLHNARQVAVGPDPLVSSFFGKIGPQYAAASAERWAQVAPIAADYTAMRDPGLPHKDRRRLWRTFAERVQAAGLYERGGWAPLDARGDDRYVDYYEDAMIDLEAGAIVEEMGADVWLP